MRDELLSQAELESLLSEDAARRASPASNTGEDNREGEGKGERVSPESPRMKRLAQHHLAALRTMHQDAAGKLAESFEEIFRLPSALGCVQVDQPTGGEFIDQLGTPACCFLLHAAPLQATWALNLPSPLAMAMIDRLMGGGGKPPAVARRALTKIERRLMTRMLGPLLAWIQETWKPLVELQLSAEALESQPRAASLAPAEGGPAERGPAEGAVVRIGLPVTLGRVTGNIQLGVPCYSIASLRPQLMSPAALEGLHRRIATASGPAKDPSQIELTAALSDSFLSPADMDGLAVGDIIATDHAIQQPLTVHVDGEPCYLARLGSHNEHKAICIESPANSE